MESVICCRAVEKFIGQTPAIAGLDLDVYEGRFVGLFGESGSGKSVFLRLAAGLAAPDSGSLLVFGKKPSARSKSRTAYLSDGEYLPQDMPLHMLVKLWCEVFADFAAAEAVELMDLFGADLNKTPAEQSHGMRRKIALALTLSRAAELYLLDEPFAALEGAETAAVLERIGAARSRGAAVVAATRRGAEVIPQLDDVLILRCGTLYDYDSVQGIGERFGSAAEYVGEVCGCF